MVKGYRRGWEPSKKPYDKTDFLFTANPDKAYPWSSKEQAESECGMFDSYRIEIPSAFGGTHICKGFKAEEPKSDEFVIFCEAPFQKQGA